LIRKGKESITNNRSLAYLFANSFMTFRSSSIYSLFAFIKRYFRKPLLFKSFTGLTVQEFDNIYNKKIAKRYKKHELQRLSNRKGGKHIKRKAGARRQFKIDTRDRFLMLLIYYRLYITYTLDGFLLIYIRVTFVETYKRLNV
jgi:hypothetical protein